MTKFSSEHSQKAAAVTGLILSAEERNPGLLLKSPRLLLNEYLYLLNGGRAAGA